MLIPAGPALSIPGSAIKDLIARVARLRKNIILPQLGRDVCGYNLQLSFLLQHIVSALNYSFRRAKLRHKIRHNNFCFTQLPYKNSQIPHINETE
jgi:hypothetical protein